MTERQAEGWLAAVDDLRKHVEDVPHDEHHWTTAYAEEVRHGRGNDLDATWANGEHFAQITVDVYGNWTASIAETEWLHSSSDEECDCEPCEKRREGEL